MRNIAEMRHPILSLLWFCLIVFSPAAVRADDCLPLLTAKLVKELGDDADAVFRIAARGSKASEGLAAALRARPDDAGLRISQILNNFPGANAEDVFEQLSLVKEAAGFDKLVVNLAKQASDAQGAAAVLRYATTKISPNDIAEFEFEIVGGVADILTKQGDVLEFKSLNLDDFNSFIAAREFERIAEQGAIFQSYAQAQGTEFVLAFENPIPTQHQALFDQIIGPLLQLPNVTFIDGF